MSNPTRPDTENGLFVAIQFYLVPDGQGTVIAGAKALSSGCAYRA
jgi:hypothetical protein